ncbi:MAG: proteasome assembly chaperone family protein, partial [Thermodesulfobacteriota bacterium]
MPRRIAQIVESVQIIEKENIRAKRPTIVVGFPSVGMVGSIAAEFLSRKVLKMREVGYIKSTGFLPVILVEKGIPRRPIRILEKDNLIVISSELVIPINIVPFVAEAIVDWAEDVKASRIISMGAYTYRAGDKLKIPEVYGVGSTEEDIMELRKVGIDVFKLGAIAELPGLILVECSERKLNSVGLFAKAEHALPDPGAAAEVLKALGKLLDVKINVSPL